MSTSDLYTEVAEITGLPREQVKVRCFSFMYGCDTMRGRREPLTKEELKTFLVELCQTGKAK